jgi:hypothetical protein
MLKNLKKEKLICNTLIALKTKSYSLIQEIITDAFIFWIFYPVLLLSARRYNIRSWGIPYALI